MPVYGGRRRGTHGLGFRRKRGFGAAGSLESMHVTLAHVGGCGGRLGDTLPTSLACIYSLHTRACDNTLVQISAPKTLKLTPRV